MNKLTLEKMLQLDEIMYIKTSNSDVLYSYKSNGKYFVDLINLNDYKIENIIKDHINDIQLISIINSDNAFLFESEINSKEETGIFLYFEKKNLF